MNAPMSEWDTRCDNNDSNAGRENQKTHANDKIQILECNDQKAPPSQLARFLLLSLPLCNNKSCGDTALCRLWCV